MGADLTGVYGLPIDPVVASGLTVEEINRITQEGFGPSPAESQMIIDEANRQRAIEAEQARLLEMEQAAAAAHAKYYAEGGTGYGTTPGGPDITYMPSDAPLIAQAVYPILDPYYGEGGVFEPVTQFVSGETDKSNLLLYAALGIGALALLRR